LKRKGFKEEIVIKIGLYDLVTSTTLESNKSLLLRNNSTTYLKLSIIALLTPLGVSLPL